MRRRVLEKRLSLKQRQQKLSEYINITEDKKEDIKEIDKKDSEMIRYVDDKQIIVIGEEANNLIDKKLCNKLELDNMERYHGLGWYNYFWSFFYY